MVVVLSWVVGVVFNRGNSDNAMLGKSFLGCVSVIIVVKSKEVS